MLTLSNKFIISSKRSRRRRRSISTNMRHMTITLEPMMVQVVSMAAIVVITIITVIVMIILAVVVVAVDITSPTTTAIDIPLPKSVLVVVHPNFQHPFIHTHFTAKFLHQILISLLHLPSNSLSKLQHPILLKLTELGSEPLS